jgi:predicted CXXCH cytochrome family protein
LKRTFQNNYDFFLPSLYGQKLDKEGMILGTNTKDVKKGVIIMRRARMSRVGLLTVLFSTLLVLIPAGYVLAISGVCSNCHTMHNSQGGSGEVKTYLGGVITPNVTTPQQYLLKADCIACHTGATGQTNSFGAPIVVHTTAPTGQGASKTLAGGDFYWVATGLGAIVYGDAYGHNVSGLAAADVPITPADTPPGWDPTATAGFAFDTVGIAWGSNQLTCAGVYGCHGQHNSDGIIGAHHGNTDGTATQAGTVGAPPTTVGSSYRFLGGISGKEETNWNWSETSSTHNEYFGANATTLRGSAGNVYGNKDTISFSCAECHGKFHSYIDDTVQGTPWLRHPTDIALKGLGEYLSYTAYSTEAPVARPTVLGSSNGVVTPGTDIVMCLSCHRAHGSPEPDLLRWTYSSMIAGGVSADTGCFTCHTTKNVAP